jgi:hypothetical protein
MLVVMYYMMRTEGFRPAGIIHHPEITTQFTKGVVSIQQQMTTVADTKKYARHLKQFHKFFLK